MPQVDNSEIAPPNASQLRVNMYENAINLNPWRLTLYNRLTEADDADGRLELGELTSRYEEALRANKKAEARALAAQLLAKPNLPGDLRKYLQQGIGGGK